MTLREWMEQNGKSVRDVAGEIGTNRENVRRWRGHIRIPDRDDMAKIFALTGGAVTADDFYELKSEADSQGAG